MADFGACHLPAIYLPRDATRRDAKRATRSERRERSDAKRREASDATRSERPERSDATRREATRSERRDASDATRATRSERRDASDPRYVSKCLRFCVGRLKILKKINIIRQIPFLAIELALLREWRPRAASRPLSAQFLSSSISRFLFIEFEPENSSSFYNFANFGVQNMVQKHGKTSFGSRRTFVAPPGTPP